jgi:DNA-binding NarL/FixJ family response regulator
VNRIVTVTVRAVAHGSAGVSGRQRANAWPRGVIDVTDPQPSIRIAIVDDHAVLRDALQHLLELQPDFQVAGVGADGVDAVRIVNDVHPDVLLLDVSMPKVNGLDALAQIPRDATRVILLTASIAEPDLLRALRLGARGIVLKRTAGRALVDHIRRIMEGRYVIDPDAIGSAAQAISYASQAQAPLPRLTPREGDVLAAVARGASNRAIAQSLSLSPQTVKHHLTSIFEKAGVSTRLELVLFAIDRGLVRWPYREWAGNGMTSAFTLTTGMARPRRLARKEASR